MYKKSFVFLIIFYFLSSFFLNTHVFAANTCSSPNFCTQDPCSDNGGSALFSCPFAGQHCCKPLNIPTNTPKPSISKCEQQGGTCIGSGACDPRASHSIIDSTCFPNGQGHVCCLPNSAPIQNSSQNTNPGENTIIPIQNINQNTTSTTAKLCIYNSSPQECETSSAPSCIQGSGPTTVTIPKNVGEEFHNYITYTITVNCQKTTNAIVTYLIPPNTVLSSADPKNYTLTDNSINWTLDGKSSLYTLNVTIATNLKQTISNQAYITLSSQGTISQEPNNNTCGNSGYSRYMQINPTHKNFGDPSCNMSKDKLYAIIKQLDPDNVDRWFFVVVPGESGYNPNAYAPPSTGTPDAGGAWGLFQMGQGKNGDYDHGNVDWIKQTFNAINYRKITINGSWRYWATARQWWYGPR